MVSNDGTSQKTTMPQGTIDTKIDAEGRLQSKTYTTGQENKISFNYTYNKNTGNIISKVIDYGTVRNIENYTYDATDRLQSVTMGGHNMQISYAPNGNILSKTDIGAYTYETTRPHAVASVENKNKTISHETQQITYTPFNKVKSIKEKVNGKYLELNITYGPDNQRVMTELKADNKLQETRLYAGNFEQVIDKNGKQTNLLYITSPDGLTHIIANGQIYYALTDHLGSVVRLYKNSTDLEFATTYDVWGASTTTINKTPWLRRGFTMHEHWPEFGLIDMNGRFYDPQLGRFLSPDPYVQNATNPQNFNRYSYCLNNPLKYTDPSGMKHQPDMNDAGFGFDGGGGGGGDFGFNAGSAAWSVGKNGTHNENISWGSSSYSTYATCNNAYYITDPSIINNYYTSGMSFDDWVDEQVRMGNATHLLGGVSVVAYNQASYDRAALNIWHQVHYADNYSGGWYTPGQSFSGGGSGTIVHIGKNESGSSRCGRCRSGNDAGGIQFSFDLYCIGGGGIDVIIGENRNGKKFIAVNVGVGIGIDAGFSSGFFTSYYNHGANTTHDYSPLNMQGWNSSLGGGFGLSDYLSLSIVSLDNENYHRWTTNSIVLGADAGGNLSAGYTFVPFVW